MLGDELNAVSPSPYTASYNTGTKTLTLSGSGTAAQMQAALKSITYRNTSENPAANDTDNARLVEIKVKDSKNAVSNAFVIGIAITGINDAPVNTTPAAQTTAEDVTKVFSVANGNVISVNDVDAGTANLQVALTAANGTLTLSRITGLTFSIGDGTADATMIFQGNLTNINAALNGLSFIPTANYFGNTSMSITTNDLGNSGNGVAQSDADNINISVTSVNDPPMAANDVLTVAEDATATVVNVLANDNTSPDNGETLTVIAVTQPANGTVTLTGGVVRFTPTANFNGTTSFTYTISDGNGGTSTATVNVTVTPVNDPPTATNDVLTVAEDVTATVVNVLANDNISPDNGETLTVIAVTQPANGTVTLTGGVVRFTPTANFNGTTSFTYTISDGNGGTSTATVNVTVTPVNDPPTATNDVLAVAEDAAATIVNVLANDITSPDNGETLTVTAVTQPTNGTVTLTAGVVRFTTAANFNGTTSFTYTISDGNGGTSTATVNVTVTPVNDAPTATNLNQSKIANQGGSAVDLDNIVVSDPDAGETITATMTLSNTAAGSLSTGTFGTSTSTFNSSSGVWTVSGSVTNVNAALAAVRFTPSVNNSQNFSITVRIRDLAGTGPTDGTISFTVLWTPITITNVSSATANGSYKVNDVIPIQLNFSESVTVTGAPQLTLETGQTDRTANYISGTGTSTLTFNYVVQAGDNTADLDYIGANALTLNGGTIRNATGNNATLTLFTPGTAGSLGANKNIFIDGLRPTLVITSAAVAPGSTTTNKTIPFTVVFSETVDGFVADNITVTNGIVSDFSGSGLSYTFNVTAITSGNVTVAIAANVTTDLAGNGNMAALQYQINYDGVLPVVLTHFTAKAEGRSAKLQWQTSSETDNNRFEVYRSGEDKRFAKITELAGHASTKSSNNYTYVDKQPLSGNNYYRLVQVDQNGTAAELGERALSFSFIDANITTYPNPTASKVTVSFAAGKYNKVMLVGIDGKALLSLNLKADQHELVLDLTSYASGAYFIRFMGNGANNVSKIIKL